MAKGLVEVSEHLSLSTTLPCTSVVQQLPPLLFPPPIPSNHGPGKVRRRRLWTISHCPRLPTLALQEALPKPRGVSFEEPPTQTPSRTTLVAPPFFMPPLPSQPPFSLPSTAPPSLGLTAHPLLSGYGPSIPSSQQQPLSPTLPISPANFSLDAHPNSRGASHRLPIFTEQWQREQELAEENRKRDAQRLADSTKAKHGVAVYAWSEDGKPPTVHEFQSKFFSSLTSRVLAARLARTSNSIAALLGVWVGVDAGYVLELHASDRIFLKASHVEDTTSTSTPTRRRPCLIYVTTSLESDSTFARG